MLQVTRVAGHCRLVVQRQSRSCGSASPLGQPADPPAAGAIQPRGFPSAGADVRPSTPGATKGPVEDRIKVTAGARPGEYSESSAGPESGFGMTRGTEPRRRTALLGNTR